MRQLTEQQANQALQFRREGYSIRDIADELGVPKSQIEKLLNQQPRLSVPLGIIGNPMVNQAASPLPSPVSAQEQTQREERLAQMQSGIEADRQALDEKARILADQEQQILSRSNMYAITTREHSRQLEQLAEREKSLSQERLALEDRYAEIQRLLQSMPRQEEQYEIFRKRARQDKLVNRHNRLLQEVLENCDECRWSGDEVDEFLERAESLKDQVKAFCDANQIDERRLLIFQGLTFMINDVQDMQDEQTSGLFSGSSVDFEHGPEHQGKIKAFMVQNFDQEAPAPVTTEDDDAPTPPDNQDDEWDNEDDG